MIQLKVKRNTYTLTPWNEKKIKEILLNDYTPDTLVTIYVDKVEFEKCIIDDVFNEPGYKLYPL